MENHASFVYAKLLNGGTLGAMIRGVTGIAQANDADQVLGLLYAALEHQERAFATPATVSVSGDDIGKFIALPAYSVIYLGE
jgi:hypothetical protein